MTSLTDTIIETKTANFVGRDYIFSEFTSFVEANDRGCLVLKGDPGAGKTAIIAEFIRRTHSIGHFNLRAQGLNTTAHFIRNIARQMGDLFGAASFDALSGLSPTGESVMQLFDELRDRTPSESPVIVAVDALDEVALEDGAFQGVNPLFLPTVLAKGVYLILTTRRQEVDYRFDGPLAELDLNSFANETMRDAKTFIANTSAAPVMRNKIATATTTEDEFIDRLVEMSEGNFMYLQYTLNDILRSPTVDLSTYLSKLPRGLENYYNYHWRLMGTQAKGPAPTANAWIIYVLCEATRPLPAWIISSVIKPVAPDASPAIVQSILNGWLQFLHRNSSCSPNEYSIYHASFRDFLHRAEVISNAGLDIPSVNQVIADLLWEHEFGEGGPDA